MRFNKFLCFFCMALFFLFSTNLYADVISLKNGRDVTVSETWEKNGKTYCSINGETISFDSENVLFIKKTKKKQQKTSQSGFKFDIWHSGITIHEILRIAEDYDIPLHRDGLISINKKFNPAMSSKYADSATKYYYKTKLLGKYGTVELFLTPSSKKLHKLSIRWNSTGKNDRVEFQHEVMNTLKRKYGSPSKYKNEILSRKYYWNPTQHMGIELISTSGGLTLVYQDFDMSKLCIKEIKADKAFKKAQYQKADINKF